MFIIFAVICYFIFTVYYFVVYKFKFKEYVDTENINTSSMSKLTPIKLYNWNEIDDETPEENRVVNCNVNFENVEFVKKCRVNDADTCSKCHTKDASCIHLDYDVIFSKQGAIKILEKNEDTEEGYCLNVWKYLGNCTTKNGGVTKIVYNDNFKRLEWICECTYPDIFSKFKDGYDCMHFNRCVGYTSNAFDENRKSINEISCLCRSDEDFIPFDKGGPKCVSKMYHQTVHNYPIPPEYVLDDKFVDPNFKQQMHKYNKILNPCLYDFVNEQFIDKKFHKNIRIEIKNDIAQCFCNAYGFTTIVYDSDYLLNNNGVWPNGVVQVSPKMKRSEIVYEVGTLNSRTNEWFAPLLGHFYDTKDLFIDFRRVLSDNLIKNPKYPFAKHNDKHTKIIIYSYPNYGGSISNRKYESYTHASILNSWYEWKNIKEHPIYMKDLAVYFSHVNKYVTQDLISHARVLSPDELPLTTADTHNTFSQINKETEIEKITSYIYSKYVPLQRTFYIDPDNKLIYNPNSILFTGIFKIAINAKKMIPLAVDNKSEFQLAMNFIQMAREAIIAKLPTKTMLTYAGEPGIYDYMFWHDDEFHEFDDLMHSIFGETSCFAFDSLMSENKNFKQITEAFHCGKVSRIVDGKYIHFVNHK